MLTRVHACACPFFQFCRENVYNSAERQTIKGLKWLNSLGNHDVLGEAAPGALLLATAMLHCPRPWVPREAVLVLCPLACPPAPG